MNDIKSLTIHLFLANVVDSGCIEIEDAFRIDKHWVIGFRTGAICVTATLNPLRKRAGKSKIALQKYYKIVCKSKQAADTRDLIIYYQLMTKPEWNYRSVLN